jgi:hypothetical protein
MRAEAGDGRHVPAPDIVCGRPIAIDHDLAEVEGVDGLAEVNRSVAK